MGLRGRVHTQWALFLELEHFLEIYEEPLIESCKGAMGFVFVSFKIIAPLPFFLISSFTCCYKKVSEVPIMVQRKWIWLASMRTQVGCSQKAQAGVPIVAQWKWICLASMRMQLRSLAFLSGSGIWCCHELWCRSQMRRRPGIAVAVV